MEELAINQPEAALPPPPPQQQYQQQQQQLQQQQYQQQQQELQQKQYQQQQQELQQQQYQQKQQELQQKQYQQQQQELQQQQYQQKQQELQNLYVAFKTDPSKRSSRTNFFEAASANKRLFYYSYKPYTKTCVTFKLQEYGRSEILKKIVDKLDILKVWIYLFSEDGNDNEPKGSGEVVLQIYINPCSGNIVDSNPYQFTPNKTIIGVMEGTLTDLGESKCRPVLHNSSKNFEDMKTYGYFSAINFKSGTDLDERTKVQLNEGPNEKGEYLNAFTRSVSETSTNSGRAILNVGNRFGSWFSRGTKAGRKKQRKNRKTKKQYKK